MTSTHTEKAGQHTNSRQHGFTLLEFSMVIVLMALIVGAIFIGHSMIRSSELRAVVTEVARYTQAVTDFRDKFRALPGDFNGATALWGAANGDAAGCIVSSGIGTQTCDGNGDGRITTQAVITAGTQYEQFRAWQHLAIAAMIEGFYTGVAGSEGPQDALIDINVPRSRLSGVGYGLISMTSNEAAASPHYYTMNYLHMLQFGSDTGIVSPSSMIGPVLTTDEALSIDKKQDDGMPGTGKIVASRLSSPFTPNCTDNDNPSVARYDVKQEGRKCSLLFLMGF
jgi:prepilin-type N-terminal cleavage/methylation domain-containing protein